MLTCAIDAKEGRNLSVTDIPGASLHTNINGDVHMILEGELADLIIRLEPKLYRKYVWRNKHSKPMMYLQLKKPYTALYSPCCYSGNYYRRH